jgi:hypothetical protein
MDKIISQENIPFLRSMSLDACSSFRESAEAYVARGGTIPLRQLVSSGVQQLVSLRNSNMDWKKINNDEFLEVLKKLHSPKSKLDAMAKFKAMSMKGSKSHIVSTEAVMQFIIKFMNLNSQLEDAYRPDEKYLTRLFINQLRPLDLKEAVFMESPSDLDTAMSTAMDQAEMISTQQQLSGVSVSVSGESHFSKANVASEKQAKFTNVKSEGSGPAKEKKAVTCYGCGEVGHTRPACPNKEKWKRNNHVKALFADEDEATRPRARVSLSSGMSVSNCVKVDALLDSGSNVSIVHPKLRDDLMMKGFEVTKVNVKVSTGNQPFVAKELMKVMVSVASNGVTCKHVVNAYVRDCGEDMILGWEWLTGANARRLLLCPSSKSQIVQSHEDDLDIPSRTYENVKHTSSFLDKEHVTLKAKYSNLFSGKISTSNNALPTFDIELEDGATFKSMPPRKLSPVMRELVVKKVQELESLGIVKKSTSKFASPIVMVRDGHKAGGYRMCQDYRMLNKATKDLQYPLQNMKSVLLRLSGKKYFAMLDMTKSFHQMPVNSKHHYLTAFTTPDGLYEYVTMPFGLKNASRHFQKVITEVLSDLLGICCEVFIDDIVIYGETETEYLRNLNNVLKRLSEYHLVLNEEKCQFGLSQIEYLGHVVNEKGMALADSRRAALRSMSEPTNTKQLRSFMGFANYFRQFVENYAILAKPLTKLCSNSVSFEWGNEQREAFNTIKHSAASSNLLSFPRSDLPLIVRTDASLAGCGGKLLQIEPSGAELIIAYTGLAFNDVQRKWDTREQEGFGVFYSVMQFAHFIRGSKFIIQTDHKNLTFISKSNTPKVIRWRLQLQEFDFTIDHFPGDMNVVADAISRLHDRQTVLSMQTQVVQNPIMMPEEKNELRVNFDAVHNSIVGHRGITQTSALIATKTNAPLSVSDKDTVMKWIQSCAICQKVRLRQPKMNISLHTTAKFDPFMSYTVDTIGPFQEDKQGNKYVLVIIDDFTRFVEIIPTADASAISAAIGMLSVFGRYGMPKRVHSDQGTQYTAKMITEFCALLSIEQTFGIPYRPQSQGKVERANQEVARHLRSLLIGSIKKENWSIYLPLVQRIMNSTPCAATGYPPAKLLYGDSIDLNRDLITESSPSDHATYGEFNMDLLSAQQEYNAAATRYQQHAVDKYLHKSPVSPTTLNVGDLVLVNTHTHDKHDKVRSSWVGPMMITNANGNVYECQNLTTLKCNKYNIDKLKLYNPDPTRTNSDVALWDAREYVVQEIIGHKSATTRGKWMFQVRWNDYGADEDTWEPYKHVCATMAFARYIRKYTLKPFPSSKYPLE